MKPYYYGNQNADTVLIQLMGEHDLPSMEQEYGYIQELLAGHSATRSLNTDIDAAQNKAADQNAATEILLVAVSVDNWNEELSPWTAPPVFGKEGFGSGASTTLAYLEKELIPALQENPFEKDPMPHLQNVPRRTFYIGGYSLAGLFALWAVYQTDLFAGAAAVSPSVWFPGFREYVKTHTPQTHSIYLSLGDKEEKTRSLIMAQVGSAIRDIHKHLAGSGISCTLEWNAGNHFQETALRTAKGWTWLLEQEILQ